MSEPVGDGFDPCEFCSELDERGPGCPWCAMEGQIRREPVPAVAQELDD